MKKWLVVWRRVAARQEARFGGQDEGGAANAVLLLDRAKKVAGEEPDAAGKMAVGETSPVAGEKPVTVLGFLGL
ncbi:hypothetical protein SESBI_26657 [Sesbania bispinosa]|nr:hypothetical protein SESBI_26657 [Sesbania bispinosa]